LAERRERPHHELAEFDVQLLDFVVAAAEELEQF
jgi:hypothetical protein